jgi:hypothetical protein
MKLFLTVFDLQIVPFYPFDLLLQATADNTKYCKDR